MIIVEYTKKIANHLASPKLLALSFLKRFAFLFPDKLYLRWKWRLIMGYKLPLNNPQSFNEKLQWLKLYNRNPKYTQMVDKVEAKKYVAGIIGEKYIIPTLAVYEKAEDIDFNSLPNMFVLKCTHDSGGIVICTNKNQLDKKRTIKRLHDGLNINYYYQNREWPYKSVKPRIIAEMFMSDDNGELNDYKFFCFDGEPRAMFIASDRFKKEEETKFDFFDMDFNHLPFTNGHPNAPVTPSKPDGFDEMKRLAAELSKGIPQVRIDFYSINGNIYFGEMTFFHWSGMVPFVPSEWDYYFGRWIHISSLTEIGFE